MESRSQFSAEETDVRLEHLEIRPRGLCMPDKHSATELKSKLSNHSSYRFQEGGEHSAEWPQRRKRSSISGRKVQARWV